MESKLIVAFLLVLAQSSRAISGHKILGLFPFACRSHTIMFNSIMEGLALRGHTVHVLSHFPRETLLANYTDLSIAGSMPLHEASISEKLNACSKYDFLNLCPVLSTHPYLQKNEKIMTTEVVQKLMKSNERYDLILTESFSMEILLGFVHKFKVPFIFLSSLAPPIWTNSLMANPQSPAFSPSFSSHFLPKMSFFERFQNTIQQLVTLIYWYGIIVPANQREINKYFGDDMPPLLDIMKNASLLLTNTHPTIFGGRPLAPNVIDIGGVHIKPAERLPHDIEEFIEESPHGVIYFCMGSILNGNSLPEYKRNAFLHTFSKLKERVLWKFENESIAIPDNIMIKKWMPQRDILAHPKVKLFISHGGLLGILEATSEGRPIVGIPIFGDQMMNIRTLEQRGIAKLVDYSSIDNDTLYEAVEEMLKPKYAEAAKELSKQFHDRPMSPMDTAVYWIEYVIRNNGARILRSPAVDMPYYQYLLLDVLVFTILCLTASVFLIYYLLKMFVHRVFKVRKTMTKQKCQ